jgi:hypothetical protein
MRAQLARKELALAVALALKRWPEGSGAQPARDAAEKEYAEAMATAGDKLSDAALLAMAGEAYMMLSPWRYYQVKRAPALAPLILPWALPLCRSCGSMLTLAKMAGYSLLSSCVQECAADVQKALPTYLPSCAHPCYPLHAASSSSSEHLSLKSHWCPWCGQDGELKESAMAAEELVNRALALDPQQPLALHLHIHVAEEASPQRCACFCPCPALHMLQCQVPASHGVSQMLSFQGHACREGLLMQCPLCAGMPLEARTRMAALASRGSCACMQKLWGDAHRFNIGMRRRGAALTAARAESSAAAVLDPAGGHWGAAGLGHLMHMASHTFVRIGRWHDAVVSNANAHAADVADAAHCQSPYEPEHNSDMLIYAANMGGEVSLGWGVTSVA